MAGAAPEVHVGKDGWLFWCRDRGGALNLHRVRPRSTYVVLWWWRLLRRRRSRCQALGARFVQLIAPDKLSVYPDKLHGPRLRRGQGIAARLARLSRREMLDLVAPFTRARALGETMLKTDTHWTHLGYLTAYRAVCAALGAPVAATVVEAPLTPVGEHVFDLGAKLDPPVAEPYARPAIAWRAERVEANALMRWREAHAGKGFVPGSLVGCRYVMRNAWEGADPRRLVIFGDSYCFHEDGLAAMLAESFAEVHVLWSGGMDWGYVARVRPEVVINETAERFTIRLPRDDVDVDAIGDSRVQAAQARRPTAASASA